LDAVSEPAVPLCGCSFLSKALIYEDAFVDFPDYKFATKLTQLLLMTTLDSVRQQTSLYIQQFLDALPRRLGRAARRGENTSRIRDTHRYAALHCDYPRRR
jgi:hypothetical protein